MLAEDVADLADGAVAVVGHRLDDHRGAAGAVALVGDFLVADARLLTRAATDGALRCCRRACWPPWRRRRSCAGAGSSRDRRRRARAATVSSLMMRVKTLPRLASSAPFLCLMECHLEWPDMTDSAKAYDCRTGNSSMPRRTRTRGRGEAVRSAIVALQCRSVTEISSFDVTRLGDAPGALADVRCALRRRRRAGAVPWVACRSEGRVRGGRDAALVREGRPARAPVLRARQR